jgi:positive regulator of sigma E activity
LISTPITYYSDDQLEKNEMGCACGTCVAVEGCIQGVVRKLEGKKPLGRPRRRLEDNIKMMFQEVRCGAWTGLI